MNQVRATIIVPTSIDRGPLLAYSVGSILRQTIREIEVFIIGDGVHDVTREAARALMRQDSRVRFFDHPKGPSRGEVYRHQALREAKGEIVCYLCDRDLMLPDHVETMLALLGDTDFATTQIIPIREDQSAVFKDRVLDAGNQADRAHVVAESGFPLSQGGHRLEAYRNLPHGWRATPTGIYTDHYMWRQFLAQPWCRARSGFKPTLLYFQRGNHPGRPSIERAAELAVWCPRLGDPVALHECLRQACGSALANAASAQRQLREPVLVGGLTPREWFRRLGRKISSPSTKQPKP